MERFNSTIKQKVFNRAQATRNLSNAILLSEQLAHLGCVVTDWPLHKTSADLSDLFVLQQFKHKQSVHQIPATLLTAMMRYLREEGSSSDYATAISQDLAIEVYGQLAIYAEDNQIAGSEKFRKLQKGVRANWYAQTRLDSKLRLGPVLLHLQTACRWNLFKASLC